jgi:hypothetical protein
MCPVSVVERAVENHYATLRFTPDFIAAVRSLAEEAATSKHELSTDLRDGLTRRLATLDRKESYFLDLAAEEGWPKDKLRDKLNSFAPNARRWAASSPRWATSSTRARHS